MHFNRVNCLTLGLATALGIICGPASAETPAQDPHRAYYAVTLGKVTGSTSIVGVKGAMTSEWERGCDGWTGTQKLIVTMDRREGAAIVSEVLASVFETHDSTRLRFTSRTLIDKEVIEQVRGRAERPSADAAGEAIYLEPAGTKISLPAGTLFPFQHTMAVLNAAISGEGRDFSPFFDGSQPEDSPLDVNSLILGAARPAESGVGAGLHPLTQHLWWPVRLAFFARGGNSIEPEIEMTQEIQENGVARRFVFDYGDFDIVATLERIEPIKVPACN